MKLQYSTNKSIENQYRGKDFDIFVCEKHRPGLFLMKEPKNKGDCGFRTSPIIAALSKKNSISVLTSNSFYRFAK